MIEERLKPRLKIGGQEFPVYSMKLSTVYNPDKEEYESDWSIVLHNFEHYDLMKLQTTMQISADGKAHFAKLVGFQLENKHWLKLQFEPI